jgi:hypothetical protein
LKSLEEMEKFLHTYVHTKLDHENISHMNKSITYNETEAAKKRLPKNESSVLHGFSDEFY